MDKENIDKSEDILCALSFQEGPAHWAARFAIAFPPDTRSIGAHWVNGTLVRADTINAIKEYLWRELEAKQKREGMRMEMGTYRLASLP